MDFRKNEIKGIITEVVATMIYIIILLAAAVIIMR